MRLHTLSCLIFLLRAGVPGFSYPALPHHSETAFHSTPAHTVEVPPAKPMALVLTVDSIHHVNCLRATGYLRVVANGGVPAYVYNWSNGTTGPLDANLLPGTYGVTVTDDEGATATVSVTILEDLVQPNANAGEDFTATCSNSVLTLHGTASTGPEFQYLWTASNGGVIQSGAGTLNPVIKHTGTFTLQVNNTINGCNKSSFLVASAANEPPAVTATGGLFSCNQPSVTLNSTYPLQNTTYVWNGPGNYVSYALHPQVAIVGTFVFKVTDTLTTCFNTANAVVTADTAKPVVLPVGGVINCNQPMLPITGTFTPPGAIFSWTGPFGFTSTQQNPVVSAAGTYRVTVTNPGNGCINTGSATVTANFTAPTAIASASGAITCTTSSVTILGNGSPAGITYSWTGPAGFTSSQQNNLVSTAGTYVLTTRNPQNGCTATSSITVVVNTTPPGVTATGGVKTCTNPTVTLQSSSNTSGVTYKWGGPGGFTSMLQNPVVSQIGTYSVTVTNPANGCTSFTSVSVTQNTTPPTLTATTATITCYTPAPHVVATSQTNGATFSWSGPNGFTSNISNPVVTVSGNYSVTATNPANGCTAATGIYVAENLATPFVFAGEDRALNCNFTSILTNPIGTSTGTNITYLWTTWDGNIVSGATTLYARFDAIGHYTLTVKNTQSGCTVKDSLEVTQTPPMTLSAVQLNSVSCNGGNNGSVKATPDGGSSPYTYIWSNGSQTATVSNLSVGTYSVTTTDSEGCTAVASVAVTQPAALQAPVSATGQTQVGVNNGTATVSPSGGTAPYTIHWSNNGSTLTITNLAPGAYTVTVTDSKGCTKSNAVTVNSMSCAISGEVSTTNLNCAGVASGTATANVNGVPTPITYLWSNGATTKTASNLAAGNYTVTVTGANGCSTVLSAQITSPQPLVLSVVSNTGVTCAGLQNGAATMNATGGTAPYSYAWSNNSTSASVSGLSAGTYSCTATDAHGCTVGQNTQITGPQAIVLSVLTKVDVACVDGQTGSITMNATGGTSPFNYIWSNSGAGPAISNLSVGNYICTVTDANGCSKNQSVQIVATDNVAPQLILKNASVALTANGTASVTPVMFDNGSFDQSCNIVNWSVNPTSFNCSQIGTNTVTLTATDKNGNTATGTALVSVVDNLAPVLTCPSNQTASACNSIVVFSDPQLQDNCTINGGATLVNGLPSGATFPVGVTQQQYSYTDAGGNTATCQFTVTVTGGLNVEPAVQPASCSGNCDGSASLTILGGGSPSSVVWSNGQTGLNAAGLCPGSYFVTITDVAGCSQTYVTQILVQDNQAPVLQCPASISAGYCNPVVTFSLPQILDNCMVNPQQLQLISGLPSGSSFPIGLTTEFYRYTDGAGNVGECSFTVTVHLAASVNSSASNATCAGACNGTSSIAVSGGQGPFGILWNNGAAGPVVANLCPGIYTATITDANGCQQVQTTQVSEPLPLSMVSSSFNNDINNLGVGSIVIGMSGGTMPYTYAWTLNGQPFATTQHLFGLFAGVYSVVVTDAHGCTFASTPFTIGTSVGTTEPEDQFHWKLYPNPAQTEVYLKMEAIEGPDTQVTVFDASGRLLYDQEIPAGDHSAIRIDMGGFPDGMLLVRLTNDKGNFSKVLIKAEQ